MSLMFGEHHLFGCDYIELAIANTYYILLWDIFSLTIYFFCRSTTPTTNENKQPVFHHPS